MISLFKVYNEAIFLLLFGLTILLNLNILFSPIDFNLYGYAPITGGLAVFLKTYAGISKWLYFILFVLIQFSSAIYFGIAMAKHKIINHYNYLPALLFVTLFAFINIYTFSSVAFLFLPVFILLFDRVFQIAVNDKNLTNAFDLGLVCGILYLSYFPYALLVVFAYFMFIILKPFYWRYWVASIIGFACPFLIALIAYTLINQTGTFFKYFNSNISFLYSKSTISTIYLLQHFLVITGTMGLLYRFGNLEKNKTIPFIRNYLFLIAALAAILLLFQLIGGLWIMELLIIIFIILAMLLTNFIIKCNRTLLKNVLHTLMLVYLVYFQYFSGN